MMIKPGYDAAHVRRRHHRRRHARHPDPAVGDAGRDGARCSASRLSTSTRRRSARASCWPACIIAYTLVRSFTQSEARPARADRGARHQLRRRSCCGSAWSVSCRVTVLIDRYARRRSSPASRRRRRRPASARWARSSWSSPIAGSHGRGLQRACYATLATSSMVLLLAVTSNIFGAVFARLGTANWITKALLALPLPPMGHAVAAR